MVRNEDEPIKYNYGLIDGDVVAFLASVQVQHNVQDPQGNVRSEGNLNEGQVAVDLLLSKFRTKLGLERDRCQIFLSDPVNNWRYDVDPVYKDNRIAKEGVLSVRPLLLEPLKKYLRDEYKATIIPGCEADDAISMGMTNYEDMSAHGNVPIAVGRDKDFKSIPGWHYQYGGDAPYYISLGDADMWHLMQSLAGDVVDGFKGCPGIGMKRAEIILAEGFKFVPIEGVLTSGKNKGQKTIKWVKEPCSDPWEIIVSCYQRAGLEEHDALTNARLARLLRWGEYDFKTGKPKLWSP